MALSEDPRDRGTIVAQGGGKVSSVKKKNQSRLEFMALYKATVRYMVSASMICTD